MEFLFNHKRIVSFIAVFLCVILLFIPNASVISASAASSYISEVEYDGSFSDFSALVSSNPSLDIELILYVLGFITSLTLVSRNVKIDIPQGAGYLDKLAAYGQYACDYIWDSVKGFAKGVFDFCHDNHLYSWSDLFGHFSVKGMASLVTKISFAIGDLVYNPTPAGQAALQVGGVTGSSASNPMNFSIFLPSALLSANALSNGFDLTRFSVYQKNNVFTQCFHIDFIGGLSSNSYLLICFSNSNYYFCVYNRVDDVFNRINVSCSTTELIQYNPPYNNSVFSVQTVPYSSRWYLNSISSNGGVFDLDAFYDSFIDLGFKGIFFVDGTNTSYALSELTEVLAPTESIDAVVNTDSNYIILPADDVIDIDLSTPIANPMETDKTSEDIISDVFDVPVSDLTINSAISGTVPNFPSSPTYNFPSLDGIWKYPRYLFNLVTPFFRFIKDCLNIGTLESGEGGVSWVLYGSFVFLICGGVLNKFLQ